MARFTGFMCDVCKVGENGEQRPADWMTLKLPGNGGDNTRDICSDKCLVKFARERYSGTKETYVKGGKVPGLSEFLTSRGVKPSSRGAISALHARRRHEMLGGVEDCLVCEFMTTKEEV